MQALYRLLVLAVFLCAGQAAASQTIIRGRILDANTREPLRGATIHCARQDCTCGCITNDNGEFETECHGCTGITVTSAGYAPQLLHLQGEYQTIMLYPSENIMQELVVTASRGERLRRSEAPVAISQVTTRMLQDIKPASADQVLNRISGVHMVSLGNEQHQMSIRQPMTTKGLFLYLEDGIPVRTTGLFNHNAMVEMNLAAVNSIEVIRGPSSSMYGSEAIGGVVNMVTLAPPSIPILKITGMAGTTDYRRADLVAGYTRGKTGFVLSAYHAQRNNGGTEYNDFNKTAVTGRMDVKFSERTKLVNSFTLVNYDSDMPGGIDSANFASGSFTNLHTFTYRRVNAFRYRSGVEHGWGKNSKTTASLVFRDNEIAQNPAYRVRDDYRMQAGAYRGDRELAHGEINSSAFRSYAIFAQHRQKLSLLNTVLIAGAAIERSPSGYRADYIRIRKDTVTGKYADYQRTDSLLSHYSTALSNIAGFVHAEFSPVKKLRVVASLRYDHFSYAFSNSLPGSSFSGAPDTVSRFWRLSSRMGATWNFSPRAGLYANYSEGFVPPQVTELFTGVKIPRLDAAVFQNLEFGGWVEAVPGSFWMDLSAYWLSGKNEIISVRQDDGSFANQNAGSTRHRGVEFGITGAVKSISARLSGAYSMHHFTDFREKGNDYSGNEINNAPRRLFNAEIWYRPAIARGFRVGAEMQLVGRYFTDPANTGIYGGYCLFNLRTGYRFKGFEIWLNMLNAAGAYYSTITTRSAFGTNYQPGEPRNFMLGLSFDAGRFFKNE